MHSHNGPDKCCSPKDEPPTPAVGDISHKMKDKMKEGLLGKLKIVDKDALMKKK